MSYKRSQRQILFDWMHRLESSKFWYTNYIFRGFFKNRYTPIVLRWKVGRAFIRYGRLFSTTRHRQLCKISGRSHYVIFKAGLARIPFKFFSGCGLLTGVSRKGY